MQVKYFRKQYTVLVKKIKTKCELTLLGITPHAGSEKVIEVFSEAIVNQEIILTSYITKNNEPELTLFLYSNINGQVVEQGSLTFDLKNEKLTKALSKQTFVKNFNNGQGSLEYKFISACATPTSKQQVMSSQQNKNKMELKMNSRALLMEETENFVNLINEKDQIIGNLNEEIQRLILETKKLSKSLSKEKTHYLKKNQHKNIELNVKINMNKNLSIEKEIQFLNEEIYRMQDQIFHYQFNQSKYLEEIESLKKQNFHQIQFNEEKTKDLRYEIGKKLQEEDRKSGKKIIDFSDYYHSRSQILIEDEMKKKSDANLADHIRIIEREKEKEKSRQYQSYIKKSEKDILSKDINSIKSQRMILRNRSSDKTILLKQINQLEIDKQLLNQKFYKIEEEVMEMTNVLKKNKDQIIKLEDQNGQLRRTKSSLLKQLENWKFTEKDDLGEMEKYQNMILKERQEIQLEKVKAENEDLKQKIHKIQNENKQKIQQKQMQIMKVKLSERDAMREKEIYQNRIHEVMSNVEGDQKKYLQALQNSNKFEIETKRSKDLELLNKDLEENNYRLSKQKTQQTNQIKKLKDKIQEREREWVRLKSLESQSQYFRDQCNKYEKSFKKFEKQYETLKQYARNVQNSVGKKPKKVMDENISKKKQSQYKEDVWNKLQLLIQETCEMQTKFIQQEIQILMNDKTSIMKKYAKKLDYEKSKIKENQQIEEDAKNKLNEQIQQEIIVSQNNETEEIDTKIAKLKILLKAQSKQLTSEEKSSLNSLNSQINILTLKMEKLKQDLEKKNKEYYRASEKVGNLEQQNRDMRRSIDGYRRSGTLIKQNSDELRKTYFEKFRQNKQLLINKSQQEYKKFRDDLINQKKKIQLSYQQFRFTSDKQKYELNDKLRQKQRQLKKIESQLSALKERDEKLIQRHTQDLQKLREQKKEFQAILKQIRDEVRQTTRIIQKKEKQVGELTIENAKLNLHLDKYEEAEKSFIKQNKEVKETYSKQQEKLRDTIRDKEEKFKNIEHLKSVEISKLKTMVEELQEKLEKQVNENIQNKNQNFTLRADLTKYDNQFKEKEEAYSFLEKKYNVDFQQLFAEKEQLDNQNKNMQMHMHKMADQINKKQIQIQELYTHIDFAEKKQITFQQIKEELTEEIKSLNEKNQQILNIIDGKDEQILQIKVSSNELKTKVNAIIEQNTFLNVKLNEKEKRVEDLKYQKQIQCMEQKNEKEKLEIVLHHIKEKNQELKVKCSELSEKNKELEEKIKEINNENVMERQNSRQVISKGQLLSPMIKKSSKQSSLRKLGTKKSIKVDFSEEKSDLSRSINTKKSEIIGLGGKEAEEIQSIRQNMSEAKESCSQNNSGPDYTNNQISGENSQISNKPKLGKVISKIIPKMEGNDSLQQSQSYQSQVENEEGKDDEEQENILEDIILENQQLKQEKNLWEIQRENFVDEIQGLNQALKTYQHLDDEKEEKFIHQDIRLITVQKKETLGVNNLAGRGLSGNLNSSVRMIQSPLLKKHSRQKSVCEQCDRLQRELSQRQLEIEESKLKIQEQEQQIEDLEKAQGTYEEQLTKQVDELLQKDQQYESSKYNYERIIDNLTQNIKLQQEKIEQLVSQGFKKQQTFKQTLSVIDNISNTIRQKQSQIETLNCKLQKLEKKFEKSKKSLQANKIQFRKYQEQAELEILGLREQFDQINQQLNNKNQAMEQLGERYFKALQETQQLRQQCMKEKDVSNSQTTKNDELKKKYQIFEEQIKKYNTNRSSYLERINNLELQLHHKNQQIKELTKQHALSLKKFEIRLSNEQKEHERTNQRNKEKEEHISNLKKEIANYNDLCYENSKEKDQLEEKIRKLQKQMKDIMVTYDDEIVSLNKDKESLKNVLEKKQMFGNNNEEKIILLNRQLKKNSQEIKHLNQKIQFMEKQATKIKQKFRLQTAQINNTLEVKKDELEKVLIQIQRDNQTHFEKQCEFIQQKQKFQKREKQISQKFFNYEQILSQLEEQLKELKARPTEDQWEEVCFENQLFKNRIDDLENKIKEGGEEREERIYTQFRKYKLSKESQINDLEAEMEKYSSKFEELEENNYVLKRDNENMKIQLRNLIQEKMRINKDLKEYQEDIRELKEEVEFYKGKRAEDLNRLLNESYND